MTFLHARSDFSFFSFCQCLGRRTLGADQLTANAKLNHETKLQIQPNPHLEPYKPGVLGRRTFGADQNRSRQRQEHVALHFALQNWRRGVHVSGDCIRRKKKLIQKKIIAIPEPNKIKKRYLLLQYALLKGFEQELVKNCLAEIEL